MQGAESHWPHTPWECAHTSERTHCWSCILSSYHCAVVQSCFIVSDVSFLDFLRPQETSCPSCLFLLHFWWRWALELQSPEALGVLCLPQHRGEQCLALPCLYGWNWEVLGSIQLSVCLVCFSTLAVRVQLLRDLASLHEELWPLLGRCCGSDRFGSEIFGFQTAFCEPWHPFCLKLFLGRRHSSRVTLKCALGAAERPWHCQGKLCQQPAESGPPPTAATCPALTVPGLGKARLPCDHTELEQTENFSLMMQWRP